MKVDLFKLERERRRLKREILELEYENKKLKQENIQLRKEIISLELQIKVANKLLLEVFTFYSNDHQPNPMRFY
jgi:predicted  nucleic acid-binding Zn-ribbon protein